GFGGGPATFFPFKSNWPPWHAQMTDFSPGSYWTVQLRCVQRAEKARSSPSGVRSRRPGSPPNLKMAPEFGWTSSGRPTDTDMTVDSAVSGGITNFKIG